VSAVEMATVGLQVATLVVSQELSAHEVNDVMSRSCLRL
jgi:hypothetical protein